jgi:outer membrane protein TolC
MNKWLLTALLIQVNIAVIYGQSRNLDFFITEGVKNSPLLNDYRNQISAAYTDSLLTRAAKMPQVEARSQLQYFPVYDHFGYDEVITDGGNYAGVLGVSQSIFNKKTNENRYNSIALQKQSLGISSALTTLELKKLITDQYLAAYTVYNDLQFNIRFLVLSKEENEIVRSFAENGICKQTDYLSLLVETQSQEIIVRQLEGDYKKELIMLNKICGLNDTLPVNLEIPVILKQGIPDISGSPAYRQFKTDSLKIENDKSAIDLRYRPKVSWFADAGFLTSNPWNFYNHFGYSAGLSLSIPVYDGRQRDMEKKKLALSEESRRAYEENYRIQYSQQVRQYSEQLNTLDETILQTNRQLETSEHLVKVLRQQLEAGIVIMTDYINAIKNYRNINRNLLLLNIQKLQVINQMNFVMTQ